MLPTVPGPDAVRSPASPARVVLFVRAGCHLCDEARALVVQVCTETGESWTEVDIDSPDAPLVNGAHAAGDDYRELVPVVEVDGIRQGYWRIDAQRLGRALAARGT